MRSLLEETAGHGVATCWENGNVVLRLTVFSQPRNGRSASAVFVTRQNLAELAHGCASSTSSGSAGTPGGRSQLAYLLEHLRREGHEKPPRPAARRAVRADRERSSGAVDEVAMRHGADRSPWLSIRGA